jgi:hypothetical protein
MDTPIIMHGPGITVEDHGAIRLVRTLTETLLARTDRPNGRAFRVARRGDDDAWWIWEHHPTEAQRWARGRAHAGCNQERCRLGPLGGHQERERTEFWARYLLSDQAR